MYKFASTLTPEQIAIIVGVLSPLIHYFFDKWRNFNSTHNYILSFAFPLLGTVAVFLLHNTTFTHLVPLYATVYATGQAVYVSAIRYWSAYNELNKLKKPEQSF